MDNELLVKTIRKLCKEHNITPSQLEVELNFGAGLISRWAKSSPSLDKIIDIADYFHVTLDEVVGHNQNAINDGFIKVLYDRTSNKEIQWHGFDKSTDASGIKQYRELYVGDFISDEGDICFAETHKQISYYFEYMHGFISIYAMYGYHDLLNPFDVRLFIQPDIQAELIPQNYTIEELLPLWVKVLTSLEDEAPDAIKAEDLKNSFVFDKTNISMKQNGSSYSKPQILDEVDNILNNPELMDLMRKFNNAEFKKIQKIYSNPEFQKTMELANRLQQYLNRINDK